MKVILKFDIINVGQQGEIKEVSSGFARNYLIPKNLVMKSNVQNIKIWEKEKIKFEKQREEIIDSAKKIAIKIEASKFIAKVKVGENGKIFGSISNTNIVDICKNAGFKIKKRDVLLSRNIKEIGNHVINVRLHPEIIAKINLFVMDENEKNDISVIQPSMQ
jgi:large subunit ribosomal protein L9